MTGPQLLQAAFARLGRNTATAASEGDIHRVLVQLSQRAHLDSSAEAGSSTSTYASHSIVAGSRGRHQIPGLQQDRNPHGILLGSNSRSISHAANFGGSHLRHSVGFQTRGLQTVTKPAAPDGDASLAEIANALYDEEERSLLTPTAIVEQLNKHIVGQEDAKRAVAIALRNRWRRSRLPKIAADEVMPKNILMIGPTGCGKTEIARRLAKLTDAPFIKVEATKYTELGYVGRDVEEVIKDLVEAAQSLVRTRLRKKLAAATAEKAEAIIVAAIAGEHADASTMRTFRELYRAGHLDETPVDIELPPASQSEGRDRKVNIENGIIMIEQMFRERGGGRPAEKKKMKVADARARIEEAESEKLLSSDLVAREAVRAAEQDGIVFIDEIDKIVDSKGGRLVSGGVSSEGVQRDLLPIIEGSTVQTKHGNVNTDHILFICSGAFHQSKPSDMLAELQGRLPIRVSLKGLTQEDFYRILTEPQTNLIEQQQALLATEGVTLKVTDGAVRAIARVAEEVNRLLDNIGARRLHTVMERILSEVSYSAPDIVEAARKAGQAVPVEYVVDEDHVMKVMADLLKKQDLSRYVL